MPSFYQKAEKDHQVFWFVFVINSCKDWIIWVSAMCCSLWISTAAVRAAPGTAQVIDFPFSSTIRVCLWRESIWSTTPSKLGQLFCAQFISMGENLAPCFYKRSRSGFLPSFLFFLNFLFFFFFLKWSWLKMRSNLFGGQTHTIKVSTIYSLHPQSVHTYSLLPIGHLLLPPGHIQANLEIRGLVLWTNMQ